MPSTYWICCAERHLAEYLWKNNNYPPDETLRVEQLTLEDLNLGIRWETNLPPTGLGDRWSDFSPTTPNPTAGGIPGARLIKVPECGHFSTIERPEIVTRELIAFLHG